ncbi:MAG: S-methyl-5-thioribose-1-phosphate isomerase [Mariprofundaceae bacterium]|nr:S-methyl-5-thioribose-1-phosphate isomerase [Mariprofundaceae bacterium]
MKVGGKSYRSANWFRAAGNRRPAVQWIEQRLLPHRFEQRISSQPEDVALAIESMQVRGAPAIGGVAAYGLALAYLTNKQSFFTHWLPRFRATRPTAVNLFHACDAMRVLAERDVSDTDMVDAAQAYSDAEVAANARMGEHLAERLAVGQRRILTHCNAGWLAAVDWGTATSGIYKLAHAGESPFVWVDETRPRLQGARLTAWELGQEGVDHCIQADSAAAWLMSQGKVDVIVTGADRIAENGDTANKIGTYMLSLAAREHGIPFYVAAPSSTFDANCATGTQIPVEERSADEVLMMDGVDERGDTQHIRIAAPASTASNPAFDVTPYANITAIISENGMWQP